jgi:hypothetical protein
MHINDFDKKHTAKVALRENFDFNFDPSKLSKTDTRTMINRVKGLITEAKKNPDFHRNQNNGSYMKLVFMAQALVEHYNSLRDAEIIVENEEVEKSQVILAAQDMVDSVQKMIEQVNDMLVKELPALTDSIQSEIGVNESSAFNSAASEALTSLNQTLSQSKTTLQTAMNQMTGVGSAEAFGAPPGGGEEVAVTDISVNKGGAPAMGAEMPGADMAPELPGEAPELPPVGGAGRAKR